jgi:hypothetical protein
VLRLTREDDAPANLAAYKTALVTADVAFIAAYNSAATTAGITPIVVELASVA